MRKLPAQGENRLGGKRIKASGAAGDEIGHVFLYQHPNLPLQLFWNQIPVFGHHITVAGKTTGLFCSYHEYHQIKV